MSDVETKDFFMDKSLVADPFPYWRRMFEDKGPVWREPFHDVVMVTGYEEASEVLRDPDRFSSCLSVTGPFPGFPVPLAGQDVNALIDKHRDELPFSDQLPTMDPPVHTNNRALMMKLLTPKRLKENEDMMESLADQALDSYLAGGSGDFIAGFAGPFTLMIIADLLGVPEEDREDFVRGINKNAGGGIGGTEGEALSHSPLQYLYDRFSEYITDRRANPRNDILTGLATALFPDGTTPEVIDVVRVATNVFTAGQETTVRLLSSAAMLLAERPELQQQLRDDPDLVRNFVEEALRIESPVKGDFRLSRVDTTIGGVDIPAGTTLMLVNGAANRDPRTFPNPDEVDHTRENARHHMAFGRGIHTCPGSPLARAEGRVGLERFLARTTEFHLLASTHGTPDAPNYRYVPTYILRGLTKLDLEFTTR